MKQYEKSDRVMETENHFENGERKKSQRLGLSLKSLLTTVILLCLCTFTNKALAWQGNGTQANPWLIGDGKTNTVAAVTAVLSGNTLTISGTGNMADFMYSTEGEAPWYPNTSTRNAIQSVTIVSGVTNIGDRAFHDCGNLTSVTIPSTVTQIGKEAFYMQNEANTSFKSITIPNSVNYVEGRAFMNCSGLETVVIQNGKSDLTFFPTTAAAYYYNDHFTGCSSLKTLHIGRQLVLGNGWVGVNPFSGNSYIQSLTIGNTITYPIDFSGCTALKEVILEDGTEDLDFNNETFAFSIFNNCPIQTLHLGRNIVNCSVWGVGASPFAGNTILTTVTIGNNVKSIIEVAFNGCTNLKNITIPNSVTSIGNQSFNGCTSLTSITIPQSVISIGNNAFSSSGLTSISIPNSITSIGSWAFAGCTNLQNVTIEDGSKPLTFGNYGFYNSAIVNFYLGRNLDNTTGAFTANTTLTIITIGKQVTSLPENCFAGTSSLTQIHSQNPTPPTTTGNNCFYSIYTNVYKTCKLYVPTGSINLYNNTNQPEWKKFFDNGNGFEEGTPTATLTVSPTSYNFTMLGGTSSAITVTSNQSWTVSSNASWLTTSLTSGSNNGTFSMTATANTSTSSRSATVTVSGGGIMQTVSVKQDINTSNNNETGVTINGVTWATRNVDAPGTFAANPESLGMFYQWNHKIGWSATDPLISSNGNANWDNNMPTNTTWEKSNDPSPLGWRVPTFDEICSLSNNEKVANEWITINGVIGTKFIDRTTGNSIFLPAVGARNIGGGMLYGLGSDGRYWSCTRINNNEAYFLDLFDGFTGWRGSDFRDGYSVRSVSESSTGIDDIFVNQLKIHPNPVKDELIIDSGNMTIENETIEIFDLSGRKMSNSKLSNSKTINVSHLQSGVYLLKIGNYRSKFIKE